MRVPKLLVSAALCAFALPASGVAAKEAKPLYLGADLSFTNEMEDCGAVFSNAGKPVDPFVLLKEKGGNIVRVRIWNNPDWTRYSTYEDVLKTIRRAHAAGLSVLLDFHYSDDWADGEKQIPPAAWAKMSLAEQETALHAYTRDILMRLHAEGQMPAMVQVGNETNPEIMGGTKDKPINWARNARLLNAGVRAVREVSRETAKPIKVMLHIAQPEHVIPWFDDATLAGVMDYDIIGISYYKKWSKMSMAELGQVIAASRKRYGADVMVVETAYPFTGEWADQSINLLGADTLNPGYPATRQGQLRYMIDLTQTVIDNGGNGMIYWAPDWVSTRCKTRWGTGSSWENAAWFDLSVHNALPVMDFLSHPYRKAE